jgi:hypothetical protein
MLKTANTIFRAIKVGCQWVVTVCFAARSRFIVNPYCVHLLRPLELVPPTPNIGNLLFGDEE